MSERYQLVPDHWREKVTVRKERTRNAKLRTMHPAHADLMEGKTLLYWNVDNRRKKFVNLYKLAKYNNKTLHVHEFEEEELSDRGFKNMFIVWMD